jgi:hypothetical protein
MKIGTLVRQKVPYHDKYRYGLITISSSKQQMLPGYIPVLWNSTKEHPLSLSLTGLYGDFVEEKSLEIIAVPVFTS